MPDEQTIAPHWSKEASKVAIAFLNKISKTTGILYEPTHVRRTAKANAAARIIAARTDVEVTDIQRRAAARWLQEEERNQENIEAIVETAIPDLKEGADPEALNEDWLVDFFERAKKVSDKEMRSLWARVLAGEANAPGSFRKSTLQCISLLEKRDAELFTSVCRFVWAIGKPEPVIFDTTSTIYLKHGLNLDAVYHLDSLGLINFSEAAGFLLKSLPKTFPLSYAGKKFMATLPSEGGSMQLGKVRFSVVGTQLARLSNATGIADFPEYAIKKWADQNVAIAKI